MSDLLEVLKSFVEHRALNVDVNIEKVLEEAGRHNILPLAVEVCSEQIDCENPVLQKYIHRSMNIMAGQVQRTGEFLRIYERLSEQGYYPLILKGIICRKLYGEYQDFRPSSDEDILIRKEEFEGVRDILIYEGYVPEIEVEQLELKQKIQEVTFHGPILNIEVHLNLNGENNEIRKRMNSYFVDVFSGERVEMVQGVTLYTLSHTDHYLFLIIHAFRHFTGGGFGIRQVLDIMLYGRKFVDEIEWEYVWSALKDLKADKFFSDMVHLGNLYLGFEQKINTKPCCVDDFLDDLMNAGAFGMDTREKHTAAQMTSAAVAAGKKSWIRTLFPSKADMLDFHPELESQPWKIVGLWIERWVRVLKKNQQTGGELIRESVRISQKRIKLLEKYGVI